MAALAGRTRRIKFGMNVVSLAHARSGAGGQAVRHHRRAVGGAPAAGLRHRQPACAGMGGARISTPRRAAARPTRAWRSCAGCGSEDSVDFDGEHYRLTGATISPKPVQADLPMWIGGSSEAAIRRTARVGTGWQAGPETPAEAGRIVAAIKAALAEAGRSIDDDHYGASFPYYFGRPADAGRAAGDGGLHASAPAAIRSGLLRRRRRRPDRRAHRPVHRRRRLQVRAASGRRRRERVMAQTRRLIEEVLPQVAARWPRMHAAAR